MTIKCPKCHEMCESNVDLEVGQHVVCPFCRTKFSYGDSSAWIWKPIVALAVSLVLLVIALAWNFYKRTSAEIASQVAEKMIADAERQVEQKTDIKAVAANAVIGQMEGCRFVCKAVDGKQNVSTVFELHPKCREYLMSRWKMTGRDIGEIDSWYNAENDLELDLAADDTPESKALRIGRAMGCKFALKSIGYESVEDVPGFVSDYLVRHMKFGYQTSASVEEMNQKLKDFFAAEDVDLFR